MDELVRWLGGQLDAEEAEARLTADAFGAVWTTDDAMESVGSDTGADVVSEPYAPRSFIAEHDPARVLAEIDAKRRILSDVLPTMRADEIRIAGEWGIGSEQVREASDDLLSLLALPYADRPGYRDEWRP